MNKEKIIAQLAQLDPEVWKPLAIKVSWFYRTGGLKPMPVSVLAMFGGEPPDVEGWREIRKGVASKRRQFKYEAKKYVLDQRKLRRRTYMRQYMKGRRDARREAQR